MGNSCRQSSKVYGGENRKEKREEVWIEKELPKEMRREGYMGIHEMGEWKLTR
jgi:hypothetical protein